MWLVFAGGLHAVDVSDPLKPKFAGCFGGDGYVHDAQCLIYRGPDAKFYGKEVIVKQTWFIQWLKFSSWDAPILDKFVLALFTDIAFQVCFCYNENTFTIVDVGNKANMKVISKKGYSGYKYTHQVRIIIIMSLHWGAFWEW